MKMISDVNKKSGLWFLISFACLATQALAWNHAGEDDLRVALEESDHALVAFILPSQDVSIALESEWLSVQETERDSTVLSIDCSGKAKICDELDVASFPAIRFYGQDGTMERYRGPRRALPISQFLHRSLRPTLTILGAKNTTSFLTIDDIVVVAHLHTSNAELHARFASLTAELRDRYTFATMAASSGDAARLRCYNNVNDETAVISAADIEAGGVGALRRFVDQCAEPLIPELGRRNEMTYLRRGKSLVHYFITTEAQRQMYIATIRPLAKRYREYLIFTTIDANEYPEMREGLGLGAGVGSGLAVQNPSNGDVFPYSAGGKISAEVVEAFLVDINNGKVKPWGGPLGAGESRHDEL